MTMHYRAPTLDRRGMSLVEMMLALSMFAVVLGVVFSFMTNSRRSYTATSERAFYQQSLRASLSLLTREIRSAGCDPEGSGLDRFAVADDQRLRVQMDLDGDGAFDGANPDENVLWEYLPGTKELQRDAGAGAITVLRDVENLAFRYFDDDEDELIATPLSAADRELVRYVDLELEGESGTGEAVIYRTRILLRND
jgi:prepilin-type N-terminal cleavage/methylation domain-containing protein